MLSSHSSVATLLRLPVLNTDLTDFATKARGGRLLASMKEIVVFRRVATNVLVVACFIHVPVFSLIAFALHGTPKLSWIVTGLCSALLPLCCKSFGAGLRCVGAALSITLVAQSVILVSLFSGHPWQVEMNFYYLAVLAMIAALFDLPLLIATVMILVALLVEADRLCPDLIYPGGSSVPRVLLHISIMIFEGLCLAAIAGAVRAVLALASSSEARASGLITQLETSSSNLEVELLSTSNRADRLASTLSAFRAEMKMRLDRLQVISGDVLATAADLTSAAQRTKQRSLTASTSAHAVAGQVNDAAVTAEEFRFVIEKVGSRAFESRRIGASAATQAESASLNIAELNALSAQIAPLLAMINGIATQTNLLALNATIEASRAGEQGRGFAVVASEVKVLAVQTSAAVSRVEEAVKMIGETSMRSKLAVACMAERIGDMNVVASAIADDVQDRVKAATSAATGVFCVARAVDEMSRAVLDIQAVADETDQGAIYLQKAACDIAEDASAIRRDIDEFAVDIIAA